MISNVWDIRRSGMRRSDALAVSCPRCGAVASKPCIGRRLPANERVSPHVERYEAARQTRTMEAAE